MTKEVFEVVTKDALSGKYSSLEYSSLKDAKWALGIKLGNLLNGGISEVLLTDRQGNVLIRATNK